VSQLSEISPVQTQLFSIAPIVPVDSISILPFGLVVACAAPGLVFIVFQRKL
jgi:hypothetical protein